MNSSPGSRRCACGLPLMGSLDSLTRCEGCARSWKASEPPQLIMANCPCCNWSGEAFDIAVGADQQDLTCPNCGSRSRHRLLSFYLQIETPLVDHPCHMLHFAPEQSLGKLLRGLHLLTRITTDLKRDNMTFNADICHLPIQDNTFDLILANHVMEHIPDDRAAHRELFRVLKPGGLALLTFPFFNPPLMTDEDQTITSKTERTRRWGRWDHYRVAGADYPDRIAETGFQVRLDRYAETFSRHDRLEYGLLENVVIFRCQKPAPI